MELDVRGVASAGKNGDLSQKFWRYVLSNREMQSPCTMFSNLCILDRLLLSCCSHKSCMI
jgi:hypothetical protein